jgi:hypothetical protein
MRSWTLLLAAISLLLPAPLLADDGGPAPGVETDWEVSPPPEVTFESPAEPDPQPPSSSAAVDGGEPELAPEPAAEAEPVAAEMSWDSFDDPSFDPTAAAQPGTAGSPAVDRERSVVLGPMAVDAQGRRGRIHSVVRGDTLWDISEAYLGTPWVWPSIWEENHEIQNPHLINPGDRIWISSTEMRIVDESEAQQILAAEPVAVAEEQPAELAESSGVGEDDLMAAEMPSALEQLPVAVPLQGAMSADTGRSISVSEREGMGFVTGDALEASTSLLDSSVPREWLAGGDEFYLGLGEGNVQVGDQFTIFRDADPVRDTDSRTLLGYHVDVLGWAEVTEVRGETSVAVVRMSRSEMHRGDRMIPREILPVTVPVKESPDGIEGSIVYMPNLRTQLAGGDYLYINRGTLHGFEVGSELEVYDAGRVMKEKERNTRVLTPDYTVADLVIVAVQPDSAVAFVVQAHRELAIGDHVRPAARRLASR